MADPVNTAWVDNLVDQINAAPDCLALQRLIGEVQTMMFQQMQANQDMITLLEAVRHPPTNLSEALALLSKLCDGFGAQYNKALATQMALQMAYTRLTTAISSKISSMSCQITIPPLPIP